MIAIRIIIYGGEFCHLRAGPILNEGERAVEVDAASHAILNEGTRVEMCPNQVSVVGDEVVKSAVESEVASIGYGDQVPIDYKAFLGGEIREVVHRTGRWRS